MSFYILPGDISTIFLGIHLITTLTFQGEITSYLYGGDKDEVFFQTTTSGDTLIMRPRKEGKFSNLFVETKGNKYFFDLKYDEKNPQQFVEVKDGMMNMALKEKVKTADYEILEGETSVLFINRRQEPVRVNGKEIKSKEYISKGVPLIWEGKRILN